MSAESHPLLHVATGFKVSAPPAATGEDSDRMVVVEEDGEIDDDDAISALPSSHFGFSAKVWCERCCSCFYSFWIFEFGML